MTTNELLKLAARITELECRIEDVAAMCSSFMNIQSDEPQPPPVDQALVDYYGACSHGFAVHLLRRRRTP